MPLNIILISDTPEKEQKLLIICEPWSKINHMPFKRGKCTIMTLNTLPRGLVFKLYGNRLKIVTSHKYFGITFEIDVPGRFCQ